MTINSVLPNSQSRNCSNFDLLIRFFTERFICVQSPFKVLSISFNKIIIFRYPRILSLRIFVVRIQKGFKEFLFFSFLHNCFIYVYFFVFQVSVDANSPIKHDDSMSRAVSTFPLLSLNSMKQIWEDDIDHIAISNCWYVTKQQR